MKSGEAWLLNSCMTAVGMMSFSLKLSWILLPAQAAAEIRARRVAHLDVQDRPL